MVTLPSPVFLFSYFSCLHRLRISVLKSHEKYQATYSLFLVTSLVQWRADAFQLCLKRNCELPDACSAIILGSHVHRHLHDRSAPLPDFVKEALRAPLWSKWTHNAAEHYDSCTCKLAFLNTQGIFSLCEKRFGERKEQIQKKKHSWQCALKFLYLFAVSSSNIFATVPADRVISLSVRINCNFSKRANRLSKYRGIAQSHSFWNTNKCPEIRNVTVTYPHHRLEAKLKITNEDDVHFIL